MFSINTRMSPVEILGRDNNDGKTLRVCGCEGLVAAGYSYKEAVTIVCNLKNRQALDGFVSDQQCMPSREQVKSLIV